MTHMLAMQQEKMDYLLQVAAEERAKIESPAFVYKSTSVYKCDYPGCNKSYSLEGSLEEHRLTHRPKNTPCDVCGKLFIHGDSVRQHKRLMHADIVKK
jgi:hypothetical protein